MWRKCFVYGVSMFMCFMASGAMAQGSRVDIVVNGNPVGIDTERSVGNYTLEDGFIEQSSTHYIYTKHPVPEGDFTVYMELSWEQPSEAGSNGHTIFWGTSPLNNVVIFAGGTDNTFRMRYITGSANEDLYDLGPFNNFVPTSEKFRFVIKSKDGYWSYWLDGQKIADGADHGYQSPLTGSGDLGIRPWNNTVRIYNWAQYDYFDADVVPVELSEFQID